MSLKLFLGLIIFAGLAVYVAFLNPQDIDVFITQDLSIHVPMVVFILGTILIGVLLSSVSHWMTDVRRSIRFSRLESRIRTRENKLKRLEELQEQADNALAGGNLKEAQNLYQRILDLHPRHANSLLQLGNNLREEDKIDRAISMHNQGVVASPKNIKMRLALAEDYARLGQTDKEIATLKRIQSIDRNSLTMLRKLRDCYLRTNDWEEAYNVQKHMLPLIHDRAEMIEEQRQFGKVIHARAKNLLERGDTQRAEAELQRAIQECNEFAPSYVTLGDMYAKNGNPNEALKTWKAGYDQTKHPIFLLRIQNALKKEQKEDVVKLYEAATRLSDEGHRPFVSLLFGSYLLQNGDSSKAVQVLESVPDKSCLIQNILVHTAKETNGSGQIPTALKDVFDKAQKSLEQAMAKEAGCVD